MASLTVSPQVTKWPTCWIVAAYIFRIHLPWEIPSGNRSLCHLVEEPHQNGFYIPSYRPPLAYGRAR